MASWFSIACGCSLAIVLAGCGSKPLPIYGTVPEFKLTAQSGQPFDSNSLNGKLWVADFIFTNCTGPCPRMTSQMRKVSQIFADRPDLKFVSITVDPARDTPTALAAYARQFHADPARWVFLTGPQPELQKLSRNVFMLGDVDGSLEHSTRFVLVDRQGRIRGFYLTSEPGAIDQLNADIRTLFKEKS